MRPVAVGKSCSCGVMFWSDGPQPPTGGERLKEFVWSWDEQVWLWSTPPTPPTPFHISDPHDLLWSSEELLGKQRGKSALFLMFLFALLYCATLYVLTAIFSDLALPIICGGAVDEEFVMPQLEWQPQLNKLMLVTSSSKRLSGSVDLQRSPCFRSLSHSYVRGNSPQ